MVNKSFEQELHARNEREMMNLIVSTAEADERIRAVLLNGSRANPASRQDDLQDYDVLYLVDSVESFLADEHWIDCFGERIMLQMPESMRDPIGDGRVTYLMLFADGNRIDLTLYPVDEYLGSALLASDTVVILDKDLLLGSIPPASDSGYRIKRPDEQEFFSCCNNFIWCAQNVAKGLQRDELPYAINILERVLRPELHDMIDWRIGALSDFAVSVGVFGKRYKDYLDEDEYSLYEQTVGAEKSDHLWCRLFAMYELFCRVGERAAACLGYEFPIEDAEAMLAYLTQSHSHSSAARTSA